VLSIIIIIEDIYIFLLWEINFLNLQKDFSGMFSLLRNFFAFNHIVLMKIWLMTKREMHQGISFLLFFFDQVSPVPCILILSTWLRYAPACSFIYDNSYVWELKRSTFVVLKIGTMPSARMVAPMCRRWIINRTRRTFANLYCAVLRGDVWYRQLIVIMTSNSNTLSRSTKRRKKYIRNAKSKLHSIIK